MSQNFKLVHLDGQGSSSSCTAKTDWKLCIICQEDKAEALTCPSKQTREVDTVHLQSIWFSSMNLASSLQHSHLKDWIKAKVLKQPWLRTKLNTIKKCRLKFIIPKLQRAQKQKLGTGSGRHDQQTEYKRTRSKSPSTSEMRQDTCFFCRQPAGHDGLREAATFQLDQRVRTCATILEDTELL